MENPAPVKMTTAPTSADQPSKIIRFIISLFQFAGNKFFALAELLARSTSATHRALSKSSPMTYRHGMGAITLQNTPFFVSLLEDIRNHLLISKSTRLIYASTAEKFFVTLGAEVRKGFNKPTERDFYHYVFYKWPTFNSFQAPASGEIPWGWVGKGHLEPNEVNILSNIVESAASPNPHSLPLDLYKLIITAIILHEISHSFIKYYFNKTITPLGVGVGERESQYGESIQETFFHERFAVEWDDNLEVGKMDAIKHVVLTSGSESWAVDVDMATKFLSSLQSPMLDWPTKATLTPFCPTSGSVRALLTETYKPVSGPIKMESPGLGITPQGGPFRSYIGYDRRI